MHVDALVVDGNECVSVLARLTLVKPALVGIGRHGDPRPEPFFMCNTDTPISGEG